MAYVGITESKYSAPELSSVAISINGTVIDEVVDGYRTLKVAGRETLSNIIDPAEVLEGSLIVEERLPSRELVITYALKAEDGQSLQERFKTLRKQFKGELEVQFKDEPNTYYYGKLTTMETVPDDTHHVISTFTIFCPRPYKFGDLVTTSGDVTIDTFYPPRPEQIILDVPQTVNRVEINHNDYRIVANGTFNAGSKAVFDFDPKDMTLTVNDVEATYMVALNSDFENFRLSDGTVASPQGDITLIAREWWL